MNTSISKIKKAYQRYRKRRQLSQLDLDFNPRQALVIAGDPRSGSTWLSELINHIPQSAVLWEPLWVDRMPEFQALGFTHRQPIPEDAEWPEAFEVLQRIFSGKLINYFLAQKTTPQQLSEARQLIVKFCRAGLMLPWIIRQFQFERPPIYIVRHPCAVVASQLKHGGWEGIPPRFRVHPTRYNEVFLEHEAFLKTIDTHEGRLAAHWCFTNKGLINHPQNNINWITTTYEHLVADGQEELTRIFKRLELPLPPRALDRLSKPSSTTVAGSPILQQGNQLEYWKKRLSPEQIRTILDVLAYFEVDLYSDDAFPTQRFE